MKTDHNLGKISEIRNLDHLNTQPGGQLFNGHRGWGDLEGRETYPTGGAAPTRTQFQVGVYGDGFIASDGFDVLFHLRHLLAKDGTNQKFFHLHGGIPLGSVASVSNFQVDIVFGYVKLHSVGRDMTAIAPITKSFIATPAELNAAAGNSMLIGGDVLIAQNGGGAGLWDCSATGTAAEIWLPDDQIMISATVISAPTVSGGLGNRVILGRKDIHEEWLYGGTPKRIATSNTFWG